jgi:iron complex transport system substrate-binding protein
MADGVTAGGRPTRRECVSYGGAVVGGGRLAGRTGSTGRGSDSTPLAEPTSTGTPEPAGEATTEPDAGYEAREPSGRLTFEEVPGACLVSDGAWADVAFALGRRRSAAGGAEG